MKYYFIYSAGGGGGEWNGLKRIWNDSVSESIKNNILLKFGDIYISHRSQRSVIKTRTWAQINNVRDWLYDGTQDEYVQNSSNILLDSGSAKISSWITYNKPNLSLDELIEEFNRIYEDQLILQKHADIIQNSNINHAITFDIPRPFKIRSQGADNRLSILEREDAFKFIDITARYANELNAIVGTEKIMPVINGNWTIEEYDEFMSKLNFTPLTASIGGISNARGSTFKNIVQNLSEFNLHRFNRVHFLGCAGLKKVATLKEFGFDSDDKFSADCSTPINRSFSDRISKYYFYGENNKCEITTENIPLILRKHQETENPYFTLEEIEGIVSLVIQHQNNDHTPETFEARSKIMLHNSDVFRKWAKE